jgi:RHS repeat-associated protein
MTEYLVDMQPSLAVILREKIGSQNTHYVHGLRGVQSQVANSAWTEAMSDGLGSVRGWIDGSQNFVSDVDYNPYGVPDSAVAGFGFTGEMTDANGLVYLRARYYDPNVGVFASLDPFEGVHGRPMSVNGYSWVEGNPINWVDPTGKCTGQTRYECEMCCWERYRGEEQSFSERNLESCIQTCLNNISNPCPESGDWRLHSTDYENYCEFRDTGNIFSPDEAWYFENNGRQMIVNSSGYLEGISFSLGLGRGGQIGREIVYNFATFQRSTFSYDGWGYTSFTAGGSMYFGKVDGFVEDYTGRFDGGAFFGQYSGLFIVTPIGIGAGVLGAGMTSFWGIDGEYPAVSGQTLYFGISKSWGFDIGRWELNYTALGDRKSYVSNCKVNISDLYNDIVNGDATPIFGGVLGMRLIRLSAFESAISRVAEFEINCNKKSTSSC